MDLPLRCKFRSRENLLVEWSRCRGITVDMAKEQLLSWIELSRAALKHNVASLARLAAGRIVAPSVKGNAYGHGLPEVVGMLAEFGLTEYVTVHSIEEAAASREAGWTRRIMLLGPIPPGQFDAVLEYDLEPVVFDLPSIRSLGKLGDRADREIRTHLKLETGTNRQGFTPGELAKVAEAYKKHQSLGRPYGASMHFANIEDTTNHEYAELQLRNYTALLKQLRALGISPKIRHTASSAATILFEKTHYELVRPGIAVYGHWPSKETYLSYRLLGGSNDLFKPVLSWKCRVTQIKQVPADSFIGYGCTYRTTAPTKLAVLPIGYYDGYGRELSNRSYVLIRGRRAPVRGRVCMNLTMVDVTDIRGARLHDEVTLIGRDGDDGVSAEQVADWGGTINYEVLARLCSAIPRLVVEGG